MVVSGAKVVTEGAAVAGEVVGEFVWGGSVGLWVVMGWEVTETEVMGVSVTETVGVESGTVTVVGELVGATVVTDSVTEIVVDGLVVAALVEVSVDAAGASEVSTGSGDIDEFSSTFSATDVSEFSVSLGFCVFSSFSAAVTDVSVSGVDSPSDCLCTIFGSLSAGNATKVEKIAQKITNNSTIFIFYFTLQRFPIDSKIQAFANAVLMSVLIKLTQYKSTLEKSR